MSKELLQNFDAFRKWFNARFSLSLNGKFAGIGRLKNWQLLAYRLFKWFNGRFRKPLPDVFQFHFGGQSLKIYSR